MSTSTPDVTELREALIDSLVMSPMSDAIGTDMGPVNATADALIAGPLAPILAGARVDAEKLKALERRKSAAVAKCDELRTTRSQVESVLDAALGTEEADGTGAGLAADVQLLADQRDEALAENERLEKDRAVLQADFNSTFEALQEAGAENVRLRATLDQVRAVCDEYPPTASTNPTDPEAMRRSARYAVASRFRRILDAADGENAGDQDDDLDYMCPNCCTPWKCNGPHIPEGSLPEGSQAALDRFAGVVKSMGQSVAYLNERTDATDGEVDQ